ncbi:glycosyltransferase [Cocleimonas sp. KMM 6892]|uniref:glycosyltransferase n=1 Tax=unclassified Cocleimonas TaxID=2639732 RepID=UPI002DC04969|nr:MULTISPECIES: glycosyltransferase [unclassified Cocleimonas]MEB8430940.1 glycosyltransferase [Cocleimonas sp. KMM 6892]MEC4714288.1 glycosyltransferase [Cocleimonas sp. KMM 6895]MEC4743619.1 glycosyltransferase [Cocleimonas sp. KMM 6896]
MKVVLLAGANSIHSINWANSLSSKKIEVHLISIHKLNGKLNDAVYLHTLSKIAPWGYISAYSEVKELLKTIKPDIVNAHYATGYGLLARLVNYKPTILSVWGSDVYSFPKKSVLHKLFLKGNLKSATAIASTSHCMAKTTLETYPHEHIFITPFGINEEKFKPYPIKPSRKNSFVIGTVKALEDTYGIDTLLRAFSEVVKCYSGHLTLILEITGEGSDREKLSILSKTLEIHDKVIFKGFIEHSKVPATINRLDIYVALSRFESYGVAILEASSCEKPVVVSDADGPSEVTIDGVTGFIVPKESPKAAANAILKLIYNPSLRKDMGKAGRQHILSNYTLEKSTNMMIDAYQKTIILNNEC